jgi:hypothetical protein
VCRVAGGGHTGLTHASRARSWSRGHAREHHQHTAGADDDRGVTTTVTKTTTTESPHAMIQSGADE